MDESEVSFGLGVPAAGGGVRGEGGCVVALRGQHGQVAGGGVEAGAVFADVGVVADLLCGSAEAVAAC